jgi:hypothetical protein
LPWPKALPWLLFVTRFPPLVDFLKYVSYTSRASLLLPQHE